jgi:hypothetical protein
MTAPATSLTAGGRVQDQVRQRHHLPLPLLGDIRGLRRQEAGGRHPRAISSPGLEQRLRRPVSAVRAGLDEIGPFEVIRRAHLELRGGLRGLDPDHRLLDGFPRGVKHPAGEGDRVRRGNRDLDLPLLAGRRFRRRGSDAVAPARPDRDGGPGGEPVQREAAPRIGRRRRTPRAAPFAAPLHRPPAIDGRPGRGVASFVLDNAPQRHGGHHLPGLRLHIPGPLGHDEVLPGSPRGQGIGPHPATLQADPDLPRQGPE